MKYYRFIVIIIFLFACDDIGKSYKWQGEQSAGFSRHYGTVGYDYGWGASYSPFDDGIVIVGQTSPIIGGDSDLWAIKTSNRGLVEWEKKFGGKFDDAGYNVTATSDGGFLFVGFSWSFGNSQQVYLIKTDFHGKTGWEKTYGGSMWEVGYKVIEVKGGGFVIAGLSNSPGISSGNTDMYLIKIDNKGELVWQKAYGNQAYPNHEWAYDLIELSTGGFLIVGARDRYNKGSLNGLVIRLDEIGNIIWEKEFLDNGQIEETIYSVSEGLGGNYFLCSTLNSKENPEVYQPKLTKIDNSGNIDWQRTFSSDGRKYHQYRATSTSLGEIVIVGSSKQLLSLGNKEDAFMIKIDSKGNILWTKSYGSSDEDDWGWGVFEKPNSNLVFVGSTKSFGSSLYDIYLVGTNPEGLSQ